jgi:hypothetical protein
VHAFDPQCLHPDLGRRSNAEVDLLLSPLWICSIRVRSFSTQNTCPGGRRWVEPIPLLDGHFAPDGSGFAVTDVAGQVQS